MSTDRTRRHPQVLGLLDIGSFKIACLILVATGPRVGAGPSPAYRVVGVGYQRSNGVKAGVITDLDKAEASVRAAVAQAERMAGVALEEVLISVSCGRLTSKVFAASADVEHHAVSDTDIYRVMAGGQTFAEREGRMLVHLNQLGFRLDGVPGMLDPRGMAARKLTADLHAVTADDGPIRNLLMVVERCYLAVAGLIPSGLASAMAVTTDAERRLGVTCIDLGGGATTLSVFSEGQFIHTETVPVGGSHLTYDIARTLQTPLAEAERIKALYGTLVGAQSDERETVSFPVAGTEDGVVGHTTKAQLSRIVRVRFESLLGLVRDRMERNEAATYAGGTVVLTGGGSQLAGAAEFVAQVLGRPVRVGHPEAMSGLPPAMTGPAFATVVGLLSSAEHARNEAARFAEQDGVVRGYLGRVGQWLKQGF